MTEGKGKRGSAKAPKPTPDDITELKKQVARLSEEKKEALAIAKESVELNKTFEERLKTLEVGDNGDVPNYIA